MWPPATKVSSPAGKFLLRGWTTGSFRSEWTENARVFPWPTHFTTNGMSGKILWNLCRGVLGAVGELFNAAGNAQRVSPYIVTFFF